MYKENVIRKDFPQFDRHFENNRPIIYLDSAATSFKPRQVIESINHYYSQLSSNVHRAIHPLSLEATTLFEETRNITF
jgi:cysteine desulfurase/selenocysteine lyase